MKIVIVPLLAFCAFLAVGCKSGADSSTTASNTSSAADTTAAKTDDATPKADAATTPTDTADTSGLVGTWEDQKDKSTFTFTADGKVTLGSTSDPSIDGTMSGTYTVGADSKTIPGGKSLNIAIEKTDLKAKDPSKQADLEKSLPDLLKFMKPMYASENFKVVSADEISLKSDSETVTHTLKKKA